MRKSMLQPPRSPIKQRRRHPRKTRCTLPILSIVYDSWKKTLKNAPDVDEKRVAELREKIIQGNYRVDSDRLAQKILEKENGR